MTNYTELSDEALSEEVARVVMGWHKELTNYPHTEDYFENWIDRDGVGVVEPRYYSPATSISAAFLMVEKMRTDGWSFACTLYEGHLPYASFCKQSAASSRNAEADTLPRAICLAALAAVEGKE